VSKATGREINNYFLIGDVPYIHELLAVVPNQDGFIDKIISAGGSLFLSVTEEDSANWGKEAQKIIKPAAHKVYSFDEIKNFSVNSQKKHAGKVDLGGAGGGGIAAATVAPAVTTAATAPNTSVNSQVLVTAVAAAGVVTAAAMIALKFRKNKTDRL